ncbi:dihydrolipoamide acetyltransferase family protein [Pseudoglutamicibacter albus]|uniref:Dihydrolipoamide acetyltransferase component of pyruvate dehydrogenase complex n=1 Tax=Pseudoglutamicibacter albus TaxID=98671 RepID=A0ABU1YWV5_9MICC|nr:dihydrolipoamide acetyltransferase family protein [Pseudoglutamicibacter albus]MDR7292825.1 pyruvate dehydrogenase E2 component (dihydrolipoamide acetyltransferase) [Pseudoglutamicibacter albus]
MAYVITMPAIVADAEDAGLASWAISVGDEVTSGQHIADIETEKATVELNAEDTGTVARLLIEPGAVVEVGAPIAVLSQAGDDDDGAVEAALAKAGVGSDDAASGAGAAEAGGADSADDAAPAEQADDAETAVAKQASGQQGSGERLFASPLARRLAKEKGLDLNGIEGSGPSGRITRRDVESAAAAAPADAAHGAAQASSGSGTGASGTQPATASGAVAGESATQEGAAQVNNWTEEAASPMRKAIARRLTQSVNEIPHFYLTGDVQVDKLLAFRKEVNAARADSEGKITVNDFILLALGRALAEMPDANSTWHDGTIRRHKTADVAVAIATEKGLLTPVITDVGSRTLGSVSAAAADYKTRAAEGKIRQHELEGGSFSVSNLGMFGTREFSAIINPPHAGILAVGAAEQQPVVRDGELTVATMMTITMSADHRVLDGAVAARFLNKVKNHLENPLSLIV